MPLFYFKLVDTTFVSAIGVHDLPNELMRPVLQCVDVGNFFCKAKNGFAGVSGVFRGARRKASQ
jgi:hypothetical protein